MTTSDIETLERKVETLDRTVNRLARQVADAEMAGWEARIEQLRLEASLGRMEVEDEFADRLNRLREAYQAARKELDELPELVGDTIAILPERLRPALDIVERAYREAKEKLSG